MNNPEETAQERITEHEQRRAVRRRIGSGWLRNNVPAPGRVRSAIQAELPLQSDQRPTVIVTESYDEFMALAERERNGEFWVQSIEVGKGPAQWVRRVKYV